MRASMKTVAAALLIFVSGAVIGVLGTRFFATRLVVGLVRGDTAVVERQVLRRLDRELDLTEAQRAVAREVVAEAARELLAYRREQAPRVDAMVDRAMSRLAVTLTPEQKTRLADMAARFRSLRAEALNGAGADGARGGP